MQSWKKICQHDNHVLSKNILLLKLSLSETSSDVKFATCFEKIGEKLKSFNGSEIALLDQQNNVDFLYDLFF